MLAIQDDPEISLPGAAKGYGLVQLELLHVHVHEQVRRFVKLEVKLTPHDSAAPTPKMAVGHMMYVESTR